MPGNPTPLELQFQQELRDLRGMIEGLLRSQQQVFTDPTGTSGDPAHGNAVLVIGSLKQICGINAFGLAYWTGSAWTQLT